MFSNLFKKNTLFLPDGRELILHKRIKNYKESDYQMTYFEALQLQNMFSEENSNMLYMYPSELKKSAIDILKIKTPTIEHIVNLINNTKNIVTFFESIDKLMEITDYLSKFDKLKIYTPGNSPREQLIKNFQNMENVERNFINRNYFVFTQKIEKLKTEKSKKNALIKYFSEWETFYYRLCPESINFLEYLKHEWGITANAEK